MLRTWRVTVWALAGLAMYVASPAKAIPIVSTATFDFTGDCTDCAAHAGTPTYIVSAQLTLQNYTLGDSITAGPSGNFVSFTYDGSNLQAAFTFTNSTPGLFVGGAIMAPLPGAEHVQVGENPSNFQFQSNTEGTWFVGPGGDVGTNGTWGVPEPSSLAVLAMGLLGFRFLSRKRAPLSQ
ncbi:MAG TPA: PEP-CTERM sorting domain-containing protein [Stellaceae bacterium]|nr:PEP-CTERM sorting domain-containing protein [Stellaceae bacterium]